MRRSPREHIRHTKYGNVQVNEGVNYDDYEHSKKVIPPLKKGTLGVHFNDSATTRRRTESKLAKRRGEKEVVSKLQALYVLNKNRNPTLASKAKSDAHYIAGSFIGKKKVNFPEGLSKNIEPKPKKVTQTKGIKFKEGMIVKQMYLWPGEPKRIYYSKITKVDPIRKGANAKTFKVEINGKEEKRDDDIYIHNFSTKIGKIKPEDGKGWGRVYQ